MDLDMFINMKDDKKSYIRELPDYLSPVAKYTLKRLKEFDYKQYPDCINKQDLVEEGPCMYKNKSVY